MTNTDKRAGWERMPGAHDIDNGKGKTYRGLVRFERACATCQERFAIHVTRNVADGVAHNTGFGLRNCENHRMKMVAAGSTASTDEVEKLRMMVKVMKEELDPLYARNAAIFAELQVLKAENATLRNKFAAYELQPAMEHAAKMPADAIGQQLAREFAAKLLKNKMPWEG